MVTGLVFETGDDLVVSRGQGVAIANKNLKRCGGSDIHSLPVNGAGAIIADQMYEFDYAGKEVTKRLPAPHPGAQGFNSTR